MTLATRSTTTISRDHRGVDRGEDNRVSPSTPNPRRRDDAPLVVAPALHGTNGILGAARIVLRRQSGGMSVDALDHHAGTMYRGGRDVSEQLQKLIVHVACMNKKSTRLVVATGWNPAALRGGWPEFSTMLQPR